jgi:hypothetical protein
VTLHVTTTALPVPGGGTANTAFLAGVCAGQSNAVCSSVDATIWIGEIAATAEQPAFRQLQYSQTVILDSGPLHWPHVTVATLRQTSTGRRPRHPPLRGLAVKRAAAFATPVSSGRQQCL